MIKARENKLLGVAPPSTDLLVCFPSRAHLTLMPKPICSPVRPTDPTKRNHHHLKRINTRAVSAAAASSGTTRGPNSPLVRAKNNQMGPEISEPTSPKVTCAGQIKVRPTSSSSPCKNWQSVMEEIERIHNRGKHKKRSKWVESFGFKKDVMNFLTCLRNIRFDFRCFGSFPEAVITSDDEEEDEDEVEGFEDDEFQVDGQEIIDDDDDEITKIDNNNNNAVFSKWFMVLQEDNQGKDITTTTATTLSSDVRYTQPYPDSREEDSEPAVPPPNALLLMRCRSAPAKSWLEEKEEEEREKGVREEEVKEVEEEKKKHRRRESLGFLMKCDVDFHELGTEIVKETWIVGEIKDPFSRSRSWRR